jgi:drug/metabolite transporter (DMT)-like permease
MILGAGIAFICALSWAGSSTILKLLTSRIDTLSINTVRLWIGSLLILGFVALSGRGAELFNTPPGPLIYVIVSGILAMAIGDSIYIKSLSLLDASIAFPLAQCSFPLMAVLVAVVFLGESFTWYNGIGSVLVVLGIYLIAAVGKPGAVVGLKRSISGKGVVLALIAAVTWTGSTVLLKIGVLDMDPFVAAGFRISTSALFLTGLMLIKRRGSVSSALFDRKNILLAASAGVLTYGIAAVGYVAAIQMIGAGKTVLLTTTAPLFVIPFSILILKESPTRHTIAGIVVCVAGICLVVT